VTEGTRETSRDIDGISARVAAWLAWSLFLLCVTLAVASLILALLNERTLGEIFMTSGPSTVTLATLIVSFSFVGTLIASHRPENPIGWIFLAEGFFYGLLSAGDEYAVYALLTNPGSLPLGA
jgi:lipopolysaccharide export LptBFGC system permease protein LptF